MYGTASISKKVLRMKICYYGGSGNNTDIHEIDIRKFKDSFN